MTPMAGDKADMTPMAGDKADVTPPEAVSEFRVRGVQDGERC